MQAYYTYYILTMTVLNDATNICCKYNVYIHPECSLFPKHMSYLRNSFCCAGFNVFSTLDTKSTCWLAGNIMQFMRKYAELVT